MRELRSKTLLRSRVSCAGSRWVHPKQRGGVSECEAIPVDEGDEFAITLTEHAERRADIRMPFLPLQRIRRVDCLRSVGNDSGDRVKRIRQPVLLPAVTPVLLQSVSRHPESPHSRLDAVLRDDGSSLPDHDQRVIQEVMNIFESRAAGDIAKKHNTGVFNDRRRPSRVIIVGCHRNGPLHVLAVRHTSTTPCRSDGSRRSIIGTTASLNEIASRISTESLVHTSPSCGTRGLLTA